MNTLVKIAARNLIKNRRRSFSTILAIALGYAAVNVFGGFTRYINTSLRDGFIYSHGNGHLTIFREGFLRQGAMDPARYLLAASEIDSLTDILRRQPEVILVTPQLYISGLLSNGQASTIFVGAGRVPSDVEAIHAGARGMLAKLTPFEGRALRDDVVYGVGLSTGLARLLGLDPGARAVAMAPTVEGQINALDAEVFQTFESPVDVLNDKMMYVPLEFARSLYDTRGADRLTVVLRETSQTERMRAHLEQLFAARRLPVEIRTWDELSVMYRKVRQMFDIIFLFLFVIVLAISVMSVVNTINMSVLERTREIGTLRALGMRRRRLIVLFAVESGLLGLIGSVLGVVLVWGSWLGVKAAEPTWVPPMITARIPLEIHLVAGNMLVSALFLLVLSVGAACLPARRAVHRGIVDALGHV